MAVNNPGRGRVDDRQIITAVIPANISLKERVEHESSAHPFFNTKKTKPDFSGFVLIRNLKLLIAD